ncbi:DUF421 domain-containing protein [Hymenobacter terrenus]|uniref:DUF421 domain-containing protein n=1 Tax=Hymenobacter terrenus TaxID=1629124 RepID=UPI0006194246|nr:YetF domain-containing protein [Hymenobacter terrenus]
MKKEDIYLWDWKRILIGNAPVEFMLEIAIRTLIIYLAFLIMMRFMGKRMNSQLNVTELSVMIMLGAIVAVAMQLPERGLLHSMLALLCVWALYRGINWWSFKSQRVARLVQGDLQQVVANGELDLAGMATVRLSREQLFAQLRGKKIQHLGQLKRVYMEANGEFSIYQQTPARPGLSIMPDKDLAMHQTEPQDGHQKACERCGHTEPTDRQPRSCPSCGNEAWTNAVQLAQDRKQDQEHPQPVLS